MSKYSICKKNYVSKCLQRKVEELPSCHSYRFRGAHYQELQEFLQALRTVVPPAPVSCLLHSQALCKEKDMISGIILKRFSVKRVTEDFLLLGCYATQDGSWLLTVNLLSFRSLKSPQKKM